MASKLFLEDGAPRSHYGQGPPTLCITNTRADSSAEQAQETSGMIPGRPQPWEPFSFSFPKKVEATSLLISESILGLKLWEWSASVSSRAGSALWMDLTLVPGLFSLLRITYSITEMQFPKSSRPCQIPMTSAMLLSLPEIYFPGAPPWSGHIIVFLSYALPCPIHHEQLELKQQNSFIFVYTKATRVPSIQWRLNKCQQNKSVKDIMMSLVLVFQLLYRLEIFQEKKVEEKRWIQRGEGGGH